MIYKLHYAKLFNDFVELQEDSFKDIVTYCMNSEFQHISREPIEVYTSNKIGGLDFPDFFYDDAVPLFSMEVYHTMKSVGIDNLFTKPVNVIDKLQNRTKSYILALPPRIDAVDLKNSMYDVVVDGYNPLYEFEKVVIDENKLGNYQIFKLAHALDNNIYITSSLKIYFEGLNPLGLDVI